MKENERKRQKEMELQKIREIIKNSLKIIFI